MKQQRLNKVLKQMKELELSQLIVTSPASLYYLIGKWISAGERMIALYLNTDGECKLLVNRLFPIEEDLGIDIIWFNDSVVFDHKEGKKHAQNGGAFLY